MRQAMSRDRTPFIVSDPSQAIRIAERTDRLKVMAGSMIIRMLATNGCETGKLLEISSGSGVLTTELVKGLPDVRISAVERSDALAELAESRWSESGLSTAIDFRRTEDDTLPFDDNSFEVIVGVGIGPSVGKPEIFFSEIERVIKPTGRVMLNFPIRTWKALYKKPLRPCLSSGEIRGGLHGRLRSCRIASPRPGMLIITNLQRPMMRPGGPGRGGGFGT
jgi:SAM-dependent methyltransferase